MLEMIEINVKIFTGKWYAVVPAHHGLDIYTKIFNEHPEAKVYFEMFNGGHEMPLDEAFGWVETYINNVKKTKHFVTG